MGPVETPLDAGRVLLVGLPGATLDPETAGRIARLAPAGLILFARNLETPAQTRSLIAAFKERLPYPTLVAVDQEGGRVSRLAPWVGATPSAAAIARAGVDGARRYAAATGGALSALGFNLDFAPVVDLCEPEAQNGIGDRSFGSDPERVGPLARAWLEGLGQHGVAGCLKHFPGLGLTRVDSHERLPVDARGRDELEIRDLVPYRRLASTAPAVMVGHAHYPGLDPEPGLPASLSHPIISGLLRGTLGYSGLVVSDDLEMGAVAPLDTDGAAAVRAVAAGCDLVLYCARLERAERAARALEAAAARDAGFARRLAAAQAAVSSFASRLAPAVGPWEQAERELVAASRLA